MQHQLISGQLKVTVDSVGAELCSIKNKNNLEFIWTANKDVWARHAPVLFPIVGKLKDNTFFLDQKKYELSQHGFARDQEFRLVEKKENSCTFELTESAGSRKSYPFDFIFYIGFELNENRLICSYKIKNPSRGQLLFSVGAHPGFNCPLLKNERFGDYYLEFEKSDLIQTTLSGGLRSGQKELKLKDNKLYLSGTLFDDDALVFENNQVNKIKLCSSVSSHQITMDCKDWPYFGVWAKKGSSQFICLEPWYGIADEADAPGDFSRKPGIIRLEPQNEFSCSFSIQID